jgi:hypothetical protein
MFDPGFAAFSWPRPTVRHGFQWVGEGAAMRLEPMPGVRFADYRPGEERTALYRTFAGLEPTPRSVLRFANRFGQLGQTGDVRSFFDAWAGHIAWMRQLVALANALGDDAAGIRTVLGPIAREDLRAVAERRRSAIAAVRVASLTDDEYAHIGLARILLALLGSGGLLSGLSLASGRDPRTGRRVVGFTHDDLAGFLLFQFARAWLGDWQLRRCDGCGKWFRLLPAVNRANRTSCSNSCRVNLCRRRRRQAVQLAEQLRAEGKSMREIAREVGSDMDTVKGWLGEGRTEHGS